MDDFVQLQGKRQFSSFWHNASDTLPDIVLCSINSFLRNGYTYNLFTYKKYNNIPEGVNVYDAEDIFPFENFYIHHSGSIAPFSDIFRLNLITKLDTWWTDTDNIMLKPELPTDDIVLFEERKRIICGLFYIAKNTELNEKLSQYVVNPYKFQEWDTKDTIKNKLKIQIKNRDFKSKNIHINWSFYGSDLFTALRDTYDLKYYDFNTFCNPLHYTQLYRLYTEPVSEEISNIFKDTSVLSLSTDLLRREPSILKNYNNKSFISTIYEKFL